MTHAPSPAPATVGVPGASRPAPPGRAPLRERLSWAVYDFANTIFSMNVATLYFAVWLVADLGATNTAVAVGNGIASLLVALSIPVLGAVSDERRRRKPWVIGFTLLACAATAAIGILGQLAVPLYGDAVLGGAARPPAWHLGGAPLVWILAAFVVANYAYQGALPFYNAMLPELVPPEEQGRLSGLGTAVGYAGTIVGLLLVSPFFNGALANVVHLPAGFMAALRSIVPFTAAGGRVSTFVPTALLFLLFALPLFFFTHDRVRERALGRGSAAVARGWALWREGFARVAHTLRDARAYPGALRFIVASFLYQDAMGTIISFMAVYAVEAMGFAKGAEVTLFVVLTIPAVAGSYLAGLLVDRIGPRRTLVLVIIGWIVLLAGMVVAPSRAVFWGVGFLIGLIYGGIVTAERPLLLTLVPEAEAGRFFGLMVLSARAAAVVGPLVWGVTVDALRPSMGTGIAYRAAVGTVAVSFALSLLLLRGVPDRRPAAA